MLGERFGITHTTLQVDHEHVDALLTISPAARPMSDADERDAAGG